MSCELPPITFKPFTRTEEKCAVVDCQYKTVQVITTGDAAGVQTVEIYDGATLLPADTELFICKEPIPTVPACDTSVETNILHEGETTFIRTTTYDVAGNITSTTDALLDGTPYTVLVPADVEGGPATDPILTEINVALSAVETAINSTTAAVVAQLQELDANMIGGFNNLLDPEMMVMHEGDHTFIRVFQHEQNETLSIQNLELDGITTYPVVDPANVKAGPYMPAVDTLRSVGLAKTIPVTGASANVQLTATTTAISIEAVGGPVRFAIGLIGVTASATGSHYLGQGNRIDFTVPAGSYIAAIQATGSTATSLEISELV